MFSEKDYTIAFEGLKVGKHQYQYKLGKTFFDAFEYGLIDEGEILVNLEFEKMSTMMVLNFNFQGVVKAECGLCLDPVDAPIQNQNRLIVKFGDSGDNDSDELISISHNEYQLNITQFLYEFVNLALPSRVIHESGKCNEEMINRLNASSASGEDSDEDEDIDPRWTALKNLN